MNVLLYLFSCSFRLLIVLNLLYGYVSGLCWFDFDKRQGKSNSNNNKNYTKKTSEAFHNIHTVTQYERYTLNTKPASSSVCSVY